MSGLRHQLWWRGATRAVRKSQRCPLPKAIVPKRGAKLARWRSATNRCPSQNRRSAVGRTSPERRKPRGREALRGTATGIRTPVSAVRGRHPSPLDDGGQRRSSLATDPLLSSSPRTRADVAELVDAHGSGPCGGNPVEVRVLSSAPSESPLNGAFFMTACAPGCVAQPPSGDPAPHRVRRRGHDQHQHRPARHLRGPPAGRRRRRRLGSERNAARHAQARRDRRGRSLRRERAALSARRDGRGDRIAEGRVRASGLTVDPPSPAGPPPTTSRSATTR